MCHDELRELLGRSVMSRRFTQISMLAVTTYTTYELNLHLLVVIEGSLEVKLPTIWTVEKQRWEESEEKRSEERRSEEKKSEERRCRCAKR